MPSTLKSVSRLTIKKDFLFLISIGERLLRQHTDPTFRKTLLTIKIFRNMEKKSIAEGMEFSRVHCPEVYAKIKEVEDEAIEIAKKEGLAAAFKFIVNSKFNKED